MQPLDSWANGGNYEQYVGRWSRLVAQEFVSWLDLPPGLSWLDVGCGTGALSAAILASGQPAAVTGVDAAEGFISYAGTQVQDPRVSFRVAHASELPFGDGTFDVVVSGLALNFFPDQDRALAEMARAARRTVAAYVWDYADGMQMMRVFWDAAVALDPGIASEDEARRFPLCRPEALAGLFDRGNLAHIEVRSIEVTTRFRDFDDYWRPFLGGQGPAPSYVARLDERRRAALRERIRSQLPSAGDGSIALIARAWAVSGRKE